MLMRMRVMTRTTIAMLVVTTAFLTLVVVMLMIDVYGNGNGVGGAMVVARATMMMTCKLLWNYESHGGGCGDCGGDGDCGAFDDNDGRDVGNGDGVVAYSVASDDGLLASMMMQKVTMATMTMMATTRPITSNTVCFIRELGC